MCGFTGRVQACVTLHPSYPQTAPPPPPQSGYSEREDEKAGTKQAALDGEPFSGGQLATIHLHPSEEQQGQEGGKRQRRACAHHWGGGEKRRRVGPSPPCRGRRQIQRLREFQSPVTSKPSGDCSHPPQIPTRRGDPAKKLSTESGPSPSCGPGPRAMLGKELYLKRQRREQNDPNTTEFESS